MKSLVDIWLCKLCNYFCRRLCIAAEFLLRFDLDFAARLRLFILPSYELNVTFLGYNELTSIPSEIGQLTQLNHLRLSKYAEFVFGS